MKIFKKIIFLIFAVMMVLTIISPVKGSDNLVTLQRNGVDVTHFWSSEKVMIPSTYTEKDTEFRGVWVATVYNLNMPVHSSETQYKDAFRNLINEVLESKMNAMLFQVRPMNDAFYDSDFAPWSRYLTGSEGNDPGWDVLGWMIDECHAYGIEFHAWMNPYRVANTTLSKESYINSLQSNNFAKMRPDLVVSGNVDSNGRNPLILNPGEPEVKTYIRNVVMEIVSDYDVDGVHFDDYFYPYSGISSDTTTYNTYKTGSISLEDWRRENVNDVVKGIKEDIDSYNDQTGNSVKFGISPFGLWGSGVPGYTQTLDGGSNTGPTNLSSYRTQYADSKKWVEEGWLHYICPQVYWSFTHSTAPYADVVDWWAQVARGTGVDVFIGHAPSAANSGNWVTEEIADQLRYNQKHPEIKGEVMYSAAFLDHKHMQYVESNIWKNTPLNVYEVSPANIDVLIDGELMGNLYVDDVTVTLSATDEIWYRLDDGIWTLYSEPIDVIGAGAHVIYMKTKDGFGEYSAIVSQNIAIQYLNNDVPEIVVTGDKIGDNYVVGSIVTLNSNTNDIYVAINYGSVGEFVKYTDPIVLTGTGRYFFRVKTIDARGTESQEVNLAVDVVLECYSNPIISIEGIGLDPYYQSATVSLSGQTQMQYKINTGSWQNYSQPFVLSDEGSYLISYRNDDACKTVFTKEIIIDNTAPEDAIIIIDGEYDGERYYITETTVSLITSEEYTDIYYRIHNGKSWSDWQKYTEPLSLLFTANFTLECNVVDRALNVSEVLSQRIRLLIPPSETNPFVIRNGGQVTYYNTNIPIQLPTDYIEKTEEIRAVWVATVSNIDIGQHLSKEQYQNEIIKMLNRVEANNFNVIFFQVRPMNDAFYDSDYAPWSRYLMGTEGQDPGWDVLEFIIEECHKRGIEFHAWLNPYRVSNGTGSKESQLAALHDENFAKQNPNLVIADNAGKLILNPGERQVQVYIRNVIRELMSKYDVDGIHFDDYFYSYSGTPTSQDSALYERTKSPGQTLDDWRRENIDTVVREIFEAVEEYNQVNSDHVKFGISPFGIWLSGGLEGSNTSIYALQSYKDQYADTKKWVEMGWLHYILPQLYWQFDHSAAPFADLVDWWAELCSENDVYLIIGHGFYRYDDDSWSDTNELPEQLRYISQYEIIIGSSFFSYKTLLSLDKEVLEFLPRLNDYYWTEYASFPWESDVVKEEIPTCPIGEVYENGSCVSICPVGEVYEDGSCVSICPIGEVYEDGSCVSICPVGEVYEDGSCVSICPVGEVYEDGSCVSICPVGEVYEDGSCISICPVGEVYEDGSCVSICPVGEVYEEGNCVSVCADGENFDGEKCIPICQDGEVLIDGECIIEEVPKTGCFLFNLLTFMIIGLLSAAGFLVTRKWLL